MINSRTQPLVNISKNWTFNQLLSLGCAIKRVWIKHNEVHILTSKEYLITVLNFFKMSSVNQFTQLSDITVYDNPGLKHRFTITYCLLSLKFNTRIFVMVKTDELTPIYSVSSIYQSAIWSEREVWDLFGIYFQNHSDLRRILTDYNFNGHPLRKDFPLSGYVDLFYDESKKHIVYTPIELPQEYRNFNFRSPWL